MTGGIREMTGQELTTITEGGQVGIFNPDAQIDMAVKAAKALSKVLAQKTKKVIINGEQYLEFEDWMTLGQFDGVSVRTGDAEPVDIDGVKGAKAKAFLVSNRTGEIIGGAEAYCMRDEEKWGTRPKYEYQDNKRVKIADEPVPWFQLASMAQTRAGSKALRNKLAWIAVLAGYRPTPAEEMTGNEIQGQTETGEHWCKEHNIAFFMRGKMKAFAHPIGDTGEWCHEHKVEKVSANAPDASQNGRETAQPPKAGGIPTEVPVIEELFPETKIDLDWLKESLDALQWADVAVFIRKNYQVTGKTVREMVIQLAPGQAADFVQEIQRRLDAKSK